MDISGLIDDFQLKLKHGHSSYDLLRVAAHFRRLELEQALYSHLKGMIVDGPFMGMKLLPNAHSSTLCPKLLGTYEAEVQADIIRLSNGVDSFLNIGCAEGYYTTALSLMAGIKRVSGVDINPNSLNAARAMAEINNTSNKCLFISDIQSALQALTGKLLTMIDVDGSELKVIDDLLSCISNGFSEALHILIETDFLPTGESNKLAIIKRFLANGFRLSKEISQNPTKRMSPYATTLTKSFLDLSIYGLEGRPINQSWLIFELLA